MTETIAVERSIVIAANQQRVWQAITDSAQMSAWFDSKMSWEFKLGEGEPVTFSMNGKVLGTG